MFPTGKLLFIESLKVEYYNGNIENKFKQQRSSETLAHREMEKLDFSFA